jgi:CrcB protein
MKVLLIGFGGFLGTITRYWISGLVSERIGASFPWGTFTVNVTGSFVIGIIACLCSSDSRFLIAPQTRDFLMIGFLGGYTTFSSFSLQTLTLMQESEWLYASGNIILSFTCCMVAVWFGYLIAKFI